MAPKARIVGDAATETDDSDAAADLADLNSAEGGELFRAIDEARSTTGAEVILTRTMPADKAGFCDKIPVSEFDLNMIKARYGAGTYRVRINGPRGFLPGGSTIRIAPIPEPAPRAAGAAGDFIPYLEFMQRQDAERRERSSKLIELGIPALATILAAVMNRSPGMDVTALIAALKPAPGPSLADLTQTLTNMRELSAPKGGDSNVDTFLKIFEAARDIQGGDAPVKGGSNWIDIVRDVIREAPTVAGPVLQAIAARRAGAGHAIPNTANTAPRPAVPVAVAPAIAAPETVAPAAPVSAGGAEAKSSEASAVNMLEMAKPMMVAKLKKIAKWASENRNPQTYAELFLDDEIPSNFANYVPREQAIEYLKHPRWFEAICEWEPTLAPFRDWCDEMREELLLLIETPDEIPEAPANDEPAAPGLDSTH